MGGFSCPGSPETQALAVANNEAVNCTTDLLVSIQRDFANLNPQHADPDSKVLQFMVVLWKYISKLADLEEDVRRFSTYLARLLETCQTDNAEITSRILLRMDWITLTIEQQVRFGQFYNDLKKKMQPSINRLADIALSCLRMASRVQNELEQLFRPTPSPIRTKILHPDMSTHTIRFFIAQCNRMDRSAWKVINTNICYQRRLKRLILGNLIFLAQLRNEVRNDPGLTLRFTYIRSWYWILKFERGTLSSLTYCVYSCAYRPIFKAVYCTLRYPDAPTLLPRFQYNWILVLAKHFRIFYNSVFKQMPPLEPLPDKSSVEAASVTKIDSFILSNRTITAVISIFVRRRKNGNGDFPHAWRRLTIEFSMDHYRCFGTRLKRVPKFKRECIRTCTFTRVTSSVAKQAAPVLK